MSKKRVDVLLVEQGLFESRSQAAAAVMAGEVSLAEDGRRVEKAGQLLAEETQFSIPAGHGFVSRGGIKLANALSAFAELDVEGARALDAGASTGGFTDCLLQAGAAHVVAVDVAYGEFHWRLRGDDRVTLIERRNVRELAPGDLPYAPDLVVADLSFISLVKVLPALAACASDAFDMLALVKPQFEVGRERVGKGGVVRDAATRRDAILQVAAAGRELDLAVNGIVSSGLPGPSGNRESFVWFARGARARTVDVETALAAVEPLS